MCGPMTNQNVNVGWIVQYQDDYGIWHDYQWTGDIEEEGSIVRHLNRNGNRTRTIVRENTYP